MPVETSSAPQPPPMAHLLPLIKLNKEKFDATLKQENLAFLPEHLMPF